MPTSTGQPIQPEQPHGFDPQKMRQLAGRLLELQSVDQSVCVDAVLEELDPSIRPVYRDSIEEYLQSVSAAQSMSPDMNTLTPEESGQDESNKTTDRVRDDATVDLPRGFEAPPRDRAIPPAKRPAARDRCFVGEGGDHLPLPEKIGKFRIKGELGRGACGVVYLGFDDELQRNVAIKVSLVADTRVQERLRIEASKAAQIDGDGIVPVYHIGTTDEGAVYIVQKYIQGTNLRAILEADGPVSPARAVSVIGEIALALEPAHSHDILHRDLKPDNILVDENGKLWIADFGLAISEEEQQGRRGELAGTPVYMSPEQIKGRIDFLDARSDIWALGVMLYELLSGKLPFNGKDRKTLTEQICELDPRPLHQRSPKYLSEDLNNVFMKCCDKKPSDRYASATELTHDLQGLIAAGLGEQNVNGETITGFVGDSPIEYDTLGTRFNLTVSGHGRLGSTVDSLEESFAPDPPASKKNVLMVGGGVLLCAVGLIALAVYEYGKYTGGSTSSAGATALSSTDLAGTYAGHEADPLLLTDVDGSEEKPWVVGIDEPHSHTTLQAAIDDAQEGHFILVKNSRCKESCLITKSLTITGAGESRDKCVLVHDRQSPITIAGADPENTIVRIENMTIDGSTIDLRSETEAATAETDTVASDTDTVASDTDTVASETDTVAAEADTVAAETDTVASDTDTVAAETDTEKTESDPSTSVSATATSEPNTISLNGGELILDNCVVMAARTNSCIKAGSPDVTPSGPLKVTALNCEFHSYGGSGASLTNHLKAEFTGCTFIRSGLQLINGPGKVTGCTFQGVKGIFLSQNTATVEIDGCKFLNCTALNGEDGYGLRAGTRSRASVKNSFFIACDRGCQVMSAGVSATRGFVEMRETHFEDCLIAAADVEGKLVLTECTVQGGKGIAIHTPDGYGHIVGGSISNVDVGIGMRAGKLIAEGIKILGPRDVGIRAIGGTIDLDGKIMGCDGDGLHFAGRTTGTIQNVEISFNDNGNTNGYGVLVEAACPDFASIRVTGGDIGFYVQNAEPTKIDVTIDQATFGGQQTCGIAVEGRSEVDLKEVDFGDLSERQKVLRIDGGVVTRPNEI